MTKRLPTLLLLLLFQAALLKADAQAVPADSATTKTQDYITRILTDEPNEDIRAPIALSAELPAPHHGWTSPYFLPYTTHSTGQNWQRLWTNTAVLSGAFVGTLFVLELLPEDATSWNRAEIQQTPLFQRWWRNIFVRNPEWDHDNPIFNYVLHPYAGSAYFMAARSCGFSFWGSMLYSAAISTIGWEFGIEAFMERPSYQDIFITPVVGSLIGELCYKGKRTIVENGYELLGSSVLGHIAAFFLDPVNEFVDIFRGNPALGANTRNSAGVTPTFAIAPGRLVLAVNF